MTGPQGLMSASLFEKIITEIRQHQGVDIILFFRGESLLHPEFIPFLRFARNQLKGKILLATNGTLCSENVSRQILDIGPDFISFSIDSINQKVFENMRLGADFENTMGNILTFISLKETLAKALPEVQVSAVKTTEVRNQLDTFVSFWLPRVDRVRVYQEHSSNGIFGSLKEKYLPGRYPCSKPVTDMVIYWNGEVALCNHDWDRQESIGDLENESIEAIWNGAKYQEIRLFHWDGKYINEPTCKYCSHWQQSYLPDSIIGSVYIRDKTAIGRDDEDYNDSTN